jgi:hypothetical protein
VTDGTAEIAAVALGTTARKVGLDVGGEIRAWMWLPALAVLAVVVALQLARWRAALSPSAAARPG